MTIETERLVLYLLSPRQLRLWRENLPALENELKVVYKADPIIGEFAEIIKGQELISENDISNLFFHSFFFIIRKSDNTVVGSSDFKYTPDETGATEIGYGLGEGFCGCGYMTETVKAMCDCAFGMPEVRVILADAYLYNLKSQNVLLRSGFSEYKRDEELVYFKRYK